MPTIVDSIDDIVTRRQLGDWLRNRFETLGLRVVDIADDLAGVSKATIYNWLKGNNIPKPPKGDAIDRFYLLLSHPDLGLTNGQRLALDQVRTRLTSDTESARPRRPMRGLPADIATFSGRESELRQLDRLLTARRTNTIVVSAVSGIGGVGKTALVVRWAHRKTVLDTFIDGSLYINLHGFGALDPLTDRTALYQLLLKLGVKPGEIPDDTEAMAALYQQTLDDTSLLLILDNAREEAQVRPLLPRNPQCTAIVTSRHRLAGLNVSHDVTHLHLDQLTAKESGALLSKMFIAAGVTASPEETSALAARCAHLPLALRIAAAAYLTSDQPGGVSVIDYARSLGQGDLAELTASATDPTSAVRAVMDSSYRRLSPDLRRALLLLAQHPGADYDVHAAAAIMDLPVRRTAAILTMLHRLSLIETDNGSPGSGGTRHRMHDLLVEYARRHPDGGAETDEAGQRLRDHHLHTALQASNLCYPFDADRRPRLDSETVRMPHLVDVAEATAWLDDNRDNLIAVAEHAAEAGIGDHVGALAITLFRYLDTGCHYQDALRLHTAAFTAAAGHDRGRAANQLAITYENLGDHARARDCARHAIAIARRENRVVDEVTAVSTLARAYLSQAKYPRAASLYRYALRLARRADHRMYTAWTLSNLGVVTLRSVPDKTQTIDYFRQAVDLNRELDSPVGLSIAQGNLGLSLELQGQSESALEHYELGLAAADEVRDRQQQTRLLANIGRLLGKMGRFPEAHSYLDRSVRLADDLKLVTLRGNVLNNTAVTLIAEGRPTEALPLAERALTLATDLDDRIEQAIAHQVIGTVMHGRGDHDAGCRAHDRAEELARSVTECNLLAEVLDAIGSACADHDPARAERAWRESATIYRQMHPRRAAAIDRQLREWELS
ncbi:tetratricopeptide repeat protein [Stackebrandtia endophytica]|uniref:Tetratricopeptide repeat protein n=1 Tax=Stackebrandtia endophytica TaxID=1496996 RepID=A0A543AVP8_9ACTN|nr:tetratricopeptide repeat protein [Stackebrandtia endophytica]